MLLSNTFLKQRLNGTHLPQVEFPEISHGDVMTSYLGLLVQGKNDFDHIEPFRNDRFFKLALDLKKVPSSPTLRQRLDMAGTSKEWKRILLEESARLLKRVKAPLTPVSVKTNSDLKEYLPLDIDVSPFDNSNTKKEGVGRTYKGTDGYAPILAYLGQEGYGVNTELREGSHHVQNGTAVFLAESIRYAKQVSSLPLLVRMDAGNDSKENIQVCLNPETQADFIIKRNPRKESPETWLAIAKEKGICCEEREGKKVYLGSMWVNEKGIKTPIRLVFHVIERTIRKDGQMLLMPNIEFDLYWTSLTCPASEVIELYRDHGTSEQFHSEIKTDMDMERLPSGKFATNDLVLHAALLAYNILRIMGQFGLEEPDAPIRKKVTRRRIRTVIQTLITLAARLVYHARQYVLRFGRHSPWFTTLKHVYTRSLAM
jgi:hypothetical protein